MAPWRQLPDKFAVWVSWLPFWLSQPSSHTSRLKRLWCARGTEDISGTNTSYSSLTPHQVIDIIYVLDFIICFVLINCILWITFIWSSLFRKRIILHKLFCGCLAEIVVRNSIILHGFGPHLILIIYRGNIIYVLNIIICIVLINWIICNVFLLIPGA